MSNFSIIATVLSMVLGLSVTRLLLGLVTVFRIRRIARIDWVPLAWAGILFMAQLEYWWAINQLPSVQPVFSFQQFVFLVLLTMMLFLSAALILPNRSEDEQVDLQSYFEVDGRYALLPLSAFLLLGLVANLTFFGQPVLTLATIMDVPMTLIPIIAFFSRARRSYSVLTLLYVPLFAIDVAISLFYH